MSGWPDAEAVVIGWLRGQGFDARAELDNNLANELPIVHVQSVGGDDDGFRLERALIEIDVYAATRTAAAQLAQQVRGLLHTEMRGSADDQAVFGRVDTVSRPAWRPYENTGLRRIGATYAIHLHPVA
jgi:hypothetical protein